MINILVVDDEKEVREMLSTVLNNEGFFVETAKDSKQAIDMVKKTPFDVALIDIELPGVKGTELISQLRMQQPKIAAIMITGHPSIENAAKSVNEKADAYILKPFDMYLLTVIIKKTLADKKNAYLHMFTEIEQANKNTPIFKYQNPNRW